MPRTLVLCFDGTANEYDGDNTNVVKFFSLLKKDDFEEQLCYYQAGIGTYFSPGMVSPVLTWCAKILDEAVAWYLNAHVMDGYRFLMNNYRVGDKVCIFGFSRGAYTARALAGMLYKVGLLPRDNEQQIPFAYKLYTRTDDEGLQLAAGFKRTFCQCVKIEFMGVWDTVASVGVIMTRSLPFTNSNTSIRTFRHALSLDEHRTKFRPNLFHRQPSREDAPQKQGLLHSLKHMGKKKSNTVSSETILFPDDEGPNTDVLEVWFSGCHTDVGGGSVTNQTSQCLANITLRWMVRQVMESQCGILFDNTALVRFAIPLITIPMIREKGSAKPDLVQTTLSPSTGNINGNELEDNNSRQLDKLDALQPIHDGMKEIPLWWILEILPFTYTWQDAQGNWHSSFVPNLGRGRMITDLAPKFHVTVKERIQSALKYKPKAVWKEGTEVYVE